MSLIWTGSPRAGNSRIYFEECLGEMTVGHMFVGGGEAPETKKVKGGLLGADYSLENGRYRIAKVYDGENWNPGLQAPLTQPGVNVKAGDYLLAVNGRDLHSAGQYLQFLRGDCREAGGAEGRGESQTEKIRAKLRWCRLRAKRACGIWRGSKAIAARWTRRPEAALRTFTCRTLLAVATPASTDTSSRRWAKRQ